MNVPNMKPKLFIEGNASAALVVDKDADNGSWRWNNFVDFLEFKQRVKGHGRHARFSELLTGFAGVGVDNVGLGRGSDGLGGSDFLDRCAIESTAAHVELGEDGRQIVGLYGVKWADIWQALIPQAQAVANRLERDPKSGRQCY